MMNPRTTLTADRLMAHTGWVRRLARTLVRDPAAADDLAHDALLVALDRPPEVREGIRSWFGRVLTNRLRMDVRASRRRAARGARAGGHSEKRLAACCALTVVDALSLLGRVPGDTVDLGLRDLGTGATLHKQMPLSLRPWARMVREMVPALQTP